MLKVGLTGGIGAGKSSVARLLAARGAVVVDADRLAREVVEPGTEGLAAVVEAFGEQVLTPEGALDRAALGRLVFTDDAARGRLNALLHPRIAALTADRVDGAGADAVVVHDVPLLVENGLGPGYHLVLVVHVDASERVRRLVADRGMTPDDARARLAAQADDDARRAAADVWLDNSGGPAALAERVDRLWDRRLAPYAANVRDRRPDPSAFTPADPATGGGVDQGVDAAVDLGAAARLRSRLAHALGVPVDEVQVTVGEHGKGGRLEARVTPPPALPGHGSRGGDGLRSRLAAAGFFEPGGDRTAGLYGGADPGLPVTVRVEGTGRRDPSSSTVTQ